MIAMIAFSLKLNFAEQRTVSDPYQRPGATRSDPQDFRAMEIAVHYHKGWPLWYAKHTDTFHAPNAPCWLDQDRWTQLPVTELELDELSVLDLRHSGPMVLRTSWIRVVFNVCFAVLLGLACGKVTEKLIPLLHSHLQGR